MMDFFQRLLLILLFFILSFTGKAQNWDLNITRAANPNHPNSVVWRSITHTAYPVGIGAPVSLMLIGRLAHDSITWHNGLEMATSIAGTVLSTRVLKAAINRPRPYEAAADVYPYQIEGTASMPSGHSSAAFATATTFSLQYKKWYVVVPAYAWAAGVGYSRLYLGVHYFTDVVTGAAVGSAAAVANHWLMQKVFNRPPHASHFTRVHF